MFTEDKTKVSEFYTDCLAISASLILITTFLLLSNISLYRYVTAALFIYELMDI